MFGLTADLLSLLYGAVALYTLWQLPGRRRALLDATYTADDRSLANRIGFLLLTPLGVLAHELAHLLAAQALGAARTSLSFRFYWGYVQYAPRLGATGDWLVAVAGPAASLLLGLSALVLAFRLRAAWRDIALAFAHATLLLVLIFYPAQSLLEGVGDFVAIYPRAPAPLAMMAGAVHAVGLVAYLLLLGRLGRQARTEARAALESELAGRAVTLRPEALMRLSMLERDARLRRLTGDERREADELRELRAWSVEHNRALSGSATAPQDEYRERRPADDAPPMSGEQQARL